MSVVTPTKPSIIRLWGVERLAATMLSGTHSTEHRALCDAIGAINALAPATEDREAA